MHEQAFAVVDTAITAATAYQREDLADRLRLTRQQLDDPTVRVMVVGEFKQGKSSLVNALLNAPVCPVDDDVATSVPTVIRYASEPQAHLVRRPESDPPGVHGGIGADDPTEVTDPIDFASVPVYASELGNPGNEMALLAVEIGLPRRILADGLVVVDTPGVGGLGSAHTAATIAALPSADVILFVSDASQEMTRTEFEFLRAAQDVCPVTAFVMTKTDFYPDWQQIRDLNANHLSRLANPVPLFTTSAALRMKAIESNDADLNQESGYQNLIEFLLTTATAIAQEATAAVVADLRSAVGHLKGTFEGEKQILEDPSQGERLMAEFTRAKERTNALRDQAARWQVTLNDGVADLTSDFDHRLRGRLRQTSIEAEAALEEQVPGDIWDEFAEWLRRRVSHDLAQTYVELARRTDDLSQDVADHFDDGQEILQVRLDPTGALSKASAIAPRTTIESIRAGAGTKAMTAMRGSYGGLLMFGMVAQMAGLAMLNPATVVIGALMGRKAVKDDRERQMTVQRQQAKATARQFIDDTGFEVGKEMKDSLKALHRQLRDYYQVRAEEMNRSIAATMAAAKQIMASNQQQRDSRLRDVKAELGRLNGLLTQVDALETTSGTSDG